jgi:putative aminopeptidase FrvX
LTFWLLLLHRKIGLRGARTAAYAFNPDAAIAVDATPANDLPVWNDDENIGTTPEWDSAGVVCGRWLHAI